MKHIMPLHGLLDVFITDRDTKFTSKFFSEVMHICSIKQSMSTSHHPQTDVLSEVMNKMGGNYLRCYCQHHQRDWCELLSLWTAFICSRRSGTYSYLGILLGSFSYNNFYSGLFQIQKIQSLIQEM